MKTIKTIFLFFIAYSSLTAQINEAELSGQGIIVPRLDRTTIASPVEGQMIYDINSNSFWLHDGTEWNELGEKNADDVISDSDDDTKIKVEHTFDEDKIRFITGGVQTLLLSKNSNDDLIFNPLNLNLFLGGAHGDANTGSSNVFLGYASGADNTTGALNTFVGREAGNNNTTGYSNVYLGYRAGYNGFGSANVFIGPHAGENAASNSKLYIENTNSESPLIYGNFDLDSVIINGTLGISNAYAFPLVDGSVDQVLQTNGMGQLSWNNIANASLTDADNDTKVMVEETADEDIIRMKVQNDELMRLSKGPSVDSVIVNGYFKSPADKMLLGSTNESYDAKLTVRNNSDYTNPSIRLLETGTHGARIFFQNTNAPNDSLWSMQGNSKDGWVGFFHRHPGDITSDAKLFIHKNKGIHIGGNNPQAKLDVNGDALIGFNGDYNNPHLELKETEADSSRIKFTNTVESGHWMVSGLVGSTNAASKFSIDYDNGSGSIPILKLQGNKKVKITNLMNLEPRDTVPGTPGIGDIYMDDGTNTLGTPTLRYYNGTSWVNIL